MRKPDRDILGLDVTGRGQAAAKALRPGWPGVFQKQLMGGERSLRAVEGQIRGGLF